MALMIHKSCSCLSLLYSECMPRMPLSHAQRMHQATTRPSAAVRGYGRRWAAVRRRFLAEHPLCRLCAEHGLVEAAVDVDHITPHGGDNELLFAFDNLQPLCKACHGRKTRAEARAAREGGGRISGG